MASGSSGKLSGLFSGGPTPSPLASPSSSPGVFTASPLPGAARGNGLEARVWLSPCLRRAQPLPSAPALAHTHPPSLPRPTWPPLPSTERERERERQSRWAEGQPLVSVGSPEPAIPQPWTSCTRPAALSCRDALSAGPGCRLLSLLQPGLFPGSSSATGRNPQGQPTPGAKLRAHGHGERPLHEVLPVKHSEPPWGTRSSRAAQGRCVGGCTDTHR